MGDTTYNTTLQAKSLEQPSPHFDFLLGAATRAALYGNGAARLIFDLIDIFELVDMFRLLPALILVVTCPFAQAIQVISVSHVEQHLDNSENSLFQALLKLLLPLALLEFFSPCPFLV